MASRGTRPSRRRLSFFSASGAPSLKESEMMEAQGFAPAGVVTAEDREILRSGETLRVLFRHAGEAGFSLVRVSFGPNYLLPRHSHSADCLYYVLAGEVRLGNRVVGAGDGFFVPKDHPYAYQAGPEGVELLEFRDATSFDFVVHEDNPGRWRTIVETARQNRGAWAGSNSA
jgi:quercetin dioxygenase-like cupin family protein